MSRRSGSGTSGKSARVSPARVSEDRARRVVQWITGKASRPADLTDTEELYVHRLVTLLPQIALIARQQARLPTPEEVRKAKNTAGKTPRSRGRPRTLELDQVISEVRFDLKHNDDLRSLGWADLPTDRAIVAIAVQRWYPSLTGDVLERKVKAIQRAVQRTMK